VTKQNLLVVDADPRSLRVLEVSLRNAGYNVAGCPSVGKALEILHANKPDLILSDTTFSDMNGFEFVEQLRQKSEWSDIPFMFLSSDGSIESKIRGLELGVEDYLTKPIYIREVIARVGIELARQARAGLARKSTDARTRFSGSLSEMSVVDLLQTIDVSRKSGVLTLIAADGQEGMISFDSGAVINATVEDLVGEDAIYRQLLWRDGTFDLAFRTVSLSERTVHRTTQALLMEGMRRLDEWSRLSELLPSFDTALEVDAEVLRERLREMPDEQNEMVRLIDGEQTIGEVLRTHGGDHVEALRKVVDLYFEGTVREVGRAQDSIPVLTEVSVQSSPAPPKEGVNTIPGPGGLPGREVDVPAAPPLPAMETDMRSTPVSVPAPAEAPQDVEPDEDEIVRPSVPPVPVPSLASAPLEPGNHWQPAPPPRARSSTPPGFPGPRPGSAMHAGGTILNWAGRVPEIERIEEVSGRETVEVGRWDSTLEELREDPEIEEAIEAIDSDPPPAAFVRSTPPGDYAIDPAATRPADPHHRDAVLHYHEPPDVDPPPLSYEQVFDQAVGEASLQAPRAVESTSVAGAPATAKPPMPWGVLLMLASVIGVVVLAFWMEASQEPAETGAPTAAVPVTGPVAVPVTGPVAAPVTGPVAAPVTGPVAVPVTGPAAVPAPVAGPVAVPGPVAGPAPVGVPVPEAAPVAEAAPVETGPAPEAAPATPGIYPATGALDTYDEQLALARRLKRGSRAVAAYRRAIELDPEASPALAELARLMLARSNTREASELAERATAVDPSNALAWVTLGAARQARGDRQGARQAYRNCVKLGKGQYVSECRAMLR